MDYACFSEITQYSPAVSAHLLPPLCLHKRKCVCYLTVCVYRCLFFLITQSLLEWKTSRLISIWPLDSLWRPHGVLCPDWLWHCRSATNWINTITHILPVLRVLPHVLNFITNPWKHTNTDMHVHTCQTLLLNFPYAHTNAIVISDLHLILILFVVHLMIRCCKRFAESCNHICWVSRDLRRVKIKSRLSALLTAQAYRKSFFNSSFITFKPTCQIFHYLSDLTVFTTPYLCFVFSGLARGFLFSLLCMFMFVFLLELFSLTKILLCLCLLALCVSEILIIKAKQIVVYFVKSIQSLQTFRCHLV